MRLLHTADWHLGRQLFGQSLIDDQDDLLDQLVRLAVDECVDAVLIAGDVYDRAVPPADAVTLLDRTLSRLVVDARIPVVLIAGNHDSAERIGFGGRILADHGLIVRGTLGDLSAVRLQDGQGTVAIHPLPYAEPVQVRALPDDSNPTASVHDHAEAMASLLARIRVHQRAHERQVLVAHAFVAGGTESDSERPLSVGGSGAVPPALFTGFHHVALGHLHRAQSVGASHIAYSGSLFKYSFDESDHTKSVSIIELDAQGGSQVRLVPLSLRRDVRVIRASFQELLTQPERFGALTDYLCAQLTDAGPVLDAMARLKQVYPHLLLLQFDAARHQAQTEGPRAGSAVHRRQPLDIFAAFAEQITGTPVSDEARACMVSAIERLQVEDRS
jgi:exonuclease SbcD